MGACCCRDTPASVCRSCRPAPEEHRAFHGRNRLHGLSMDDVPLKETVGGTRWSYRSFPLWFYDSMTVDAGCALGWEAWVAFAIPCAGCHALQSNALWDMHWFPSGTPLQCWVICNLFPLVVYIYIYYSAVFTKIIVWFEFQVSNIALHEHKIVYFHSSTFLVKFVAVLG